MKFLHLSDLHLGKRLNDVSLIEDQKYALAQAVRAAKAENADAVIIAGDVYQKAAPPAEAMALFNDFLTELADCGIKVFVISGNHDSALRVSYLSALVRQAGIYITEDFTGKLQQHTVTDAYGTVTIHLLPFIKPIYVKKLFPDRVIETYQDAVEAVLENSPIDPAQRNILICHQFITGAETSDSEEHSVGGLDNIDSGLFSAFDYVALGHIHKPQKISRASLRYCGSLLKYSFSEATHNKEFLFVELREKGNLALTTHPLQPLHDLREVRGSMYEVMHMPYSEDYVRVTLTDEIIPPDARVTISTVFPNIMALAVDNSKTAADAELMEVGSIQDKSIEELFCDFYRLMNSDVMPSDDLLHVLRTVLEEMEANDK